jgi:hypothetical protein
MILSHLFILGACGGAINGYIHYSEASNTVLPVTVFYTLCCIKQLYYVLNMAEEI